MKVKGKVSFRVPGPTVYVYLARQARAHALDERDDSEINRDITFLTRYRTKLGPFTITTTEEATFDPGNSITWRHVDGPLTGSSEQFVIQPHPSAVAYTGDVVPRNRLLRGPLAWVVAQMTRHVSISSLWTAKRTLERDLGPRRRPEYLDDGGPDYDGNGGGD
jgi:hypothetical protein